jgi:hypothetical protein
VHWNSGTKQCLLHRLGPHFSTPHEPYDEMFVSRSEAAISGKTSTGTDQMTDDTETAWHREQIAKNRTILSADRDA